MSEKAEEWQIQDSKLGTSDSRFYACSLPLKQNYTKQDTFIAPTVQIALEHCVNLRASLILPKMALVLR